MNSAVTADNLTLPSNRKSSQSPASAVLSYAILLAGLLTAGAAVYMVIASYSSLPSTDGWEQIDTAMRGVNPLSPAWLWTQHNEHRMVVSKLFLAADLVLFRATQKFLLTSILVTQFLLLMVLAWSMRVLGGWRGAVWRTGVGIAAFCLFWPTQWENLVIGFSICFILLELFSTLSFVALILYWKHSEQSDDREAWVYLLFSILAALGATYSLANGNLLWPLLFAAALLLRLRRAAVLSLLITGTVSTAAVSLRLPSSAGPRQPGFVNPDAARDLPVHRHILRKPMGAARRSPGDTHWNRRVGGRGFRALSASAHTSELAVPSRSCLC